MPNGTCESNSRFDTGLLTPDGGATTSTASGTILPTSGGPPVDPSTLVPDPSQHFSSRFDWGSVADVLSNYTII